MAGAQDDFDALIFGYHDGRPRLIYAARTRNGFTPSSRDALIREIQGAGHRGIIVLVPPPSRRGSTIALVPPFVTHCLGSASGRIPTPMQDACKRVTSLLRGFTFGISHHACGSVKLVWRQQQRLPEKSTPALQQGRVKDAVTRGSGALIAKSAIRTLGRTELHPVAFRIFLGAAVGRVYHPLADISGRVDSRSRIHQAQRPEGFIN